MPALAPAGVPNSCPVVELKEAQAHAGRFAVEFQNVVVTIPGNWSERVRAARVDSSTRCGGVPSIVGALFGAAVRLIANGASVALALPSLKPSVWLAASTAVGRKL